LKVLIADNPEGDRRIAEILAGYELEFVRTLDAAQRALERERYALILVGVHFDESRMFDLLRDLQARGQPSGCAVICMRTHRFASPAITIEGLEIAARALGCHLFLDLTWYADDAAGNGAVRQLLQALISA
jgi:DNA-binding response OmpR family regulator